MFSRKKKKKEEVVEEVEEEPEDEEPLELPEEAPPKPPKKVAKTEPKALGEFSLTKDEMALAVNALTASEEYKLYQQVALGQQVAQILADYDKAVKDEVQEDLPQPR